MYIDNFTIGADPELFIVNSKTDKVVSSIGLIPGVKGDPYVDKCMPSGFGLETDNILAEFNIPPCKTKESFVTSIEWMKSYIRDFVKRVNPDYDIKCSASEFVDPDQLQSDEAKQFGCSVDYNAYTQEPNPKPNGQSTNLRSAGCHIHIGYNGYNTRTSVNLIRLFDLYVGVPSILIDNDIRRRNLYGKAGAFRLTSYGCEARILSSYMMSTPQLICWIWDHVMLVIDAYNAGNSCSDTSAVIKAINESDKDLATRICRKYNIPV